ncbi:NrsF family protein [Azorhizobium doebereinerae]|uniref:NrsF family protein n=1 Tax=Azorhizobium doebereinerae TaxID=281091 RepID=UPI0004184919|nr:NrsF family protein [Azorhizobium doebereinerae]
MKTEDLLRGLAADTRTGPGLGSGLALALCAGLAGTALLFAATLAVRANFAALLLDPRILLKFAVTLSLAGAAAALALRLSRPGAAARPAARLLLVPLLVLAIGVGTELARTPERSWMPGLVGQYAVYCVLLIPLMAAPVLGAVLLALRRGAPGHPAWAGAAAGLLAGGLGAACYALHCTDDSPLFVLAWYGLAIGAVTLAGALLGRRLLAW